MFLYLYPDLHHIPVDIYYLQKEMEEEYEVAMSGIEGPTKSSIILPIVALMKFHSLGGFHQHTESDSSGC